MRKLFLLCGLLLSLVFVAGASSPPLVDNFHQEQCISPQDQTTDFVTVLETPAELPVNSFLLPPCRAVHFKKVALVEFLPVSALHRKPISYPLKTTLSLVEKKADFQLQPFT